MSGTNQGGPAGSNGQGQTAGESPSVGHPELSRVIGLKGAILLGLGSILGTGVFVSIGIAAGAAGPGLILAVVLAAGVAMCNALSSAQLAAAYPVSGGTYEYGNRLLNPALGFTAGWMFLCAKSASAATAALGVAGYLAYALGIHSANGSVWVALVTVVLVTGAVAAGMRRSNFVNSILVGFVLLVLLVFIVGGSPVLAVAHPDTYVPFFSAANRGGEAFAGLLEGTALMFVAFTGYGRIATLGEEVRDPSRVIPRAILVTMVVSGLLYFGVALVAVATVGAPALHAATLGSATLSNGMIVSTSTAGATLQRVAEGGLVPGLPWLLGIAAIAAMVGVLLNLVLGLSRVLLAMGRRGDMPRVVARVGPKSGNPTIAALVIGGVVFALAATCSLRVAWSFSAFTVLIYYAITNVCALRLPAEQRLHSPLFAWGGLLSCGFLAFWIDWRVWLVGLGIIALGLVWHGCARRLRTAES